MARCFTGGADYAALIDALAEAGDFGHIIQHAKAAGIANIGDQAENRIRADVDEGASARTHGSAAVVALFEAWNSAAPSTAPVWLSHAAKSASARWECISFFALPRSRTDSGGNRPKFTFIGWKRLRSGSVM